MRLGRSRPAVAVLEFRSVLRLRALLGLRAVLLLGAALGVLLAACGPPPDLAEVAASPTPPVTLPATPSPAPTLPALPTPATPAPGFVEDRAVSCDGYPDGDELLSLLQAEEVLAEEHEATVGHGPLCAGTWQYAVVTVPDLDPLEVVSRGEPGALELVTAGTEVCTVDVRVRAPSGILAATDCVG